MIQYNKICNNNMILSILVKYNSLQAALYTKLLCMVLLAQQ